MTFATILLDASHAAQAAAEAHHHHAHGGPRVSGILLGVGLTFFVLFLVRLIRRRRRFGFGPRHAMRRLFQRLDTSPSQEKVIREALASLREAFSGWREGGRAMRQGLAGALAGEAFDGASLDAAFAVPESKLPELRAAVARALGSIHDVLTPAQRKELAAIVAAGPRFFFLHRAHRHGC